MRCGRILAFALLGLGLASLSAPGQDDRRARREARREKAKKLREALKEFRKASSSREESDRIRAIQELARTAIDLKEDKAIDPITAFCFKDTEAVRIAAIEALAGIDHPKSVDALARALHRHKKVKRVLKKIIQGLRQLRWEAGAEPLHDLLKEYQDPEILPIVPDVLAALGEIGSPTSIQPILDILSAAELNGSGSYNPQAGAQTPGLGSMGGLAQALRNPRIEKLRDPALKALAAITGRPPSGSATEWQQWLRKDGRTWESRLWEVHWCPDTWERWKRWPGRETTCPYNKRHGGSDPVARRTHKK